MPPQRHDYTLLLSTLNLKYYLTRGPRTLQRRLELQIVQPVDRFDIDAPLLAAVLDIEWNRRTRGTDGPDLAIEIRKPARRSARDAYDIFAFAQSCFFARPSRGQAADRETPGGLLRRNTN